MPTISNYRGGERRLAGGHADRHAARPAPCRQRAAFAAHRPAYAARRDGRPRGLFAGRQAAAITGQDIAICGGASLPK
jgi:hypothetical protein